MSFAFCTKYPNWTGISVKSRLPNSRRLTGTLLKSGAKFSATVTATVRIPVKLAAIAGCQQMHGQLAFH
jgi:hypothetical protein